MDVDVEPFDGRTGGGMGRLEIISHAEGVNIEPVIIVGLSFLMGY